MIVPRYWAEARAQARQHGRQITVRRHGWSDDSDTAAQAHAQTRADDALARMLAGEKLDRREPKLPYNGADGVPIREEILDRSGDTILTRNAYGAQCLNTPSVMFVDIDFATTPRYDIPAGTFLSLIAIAFAIGWWQDSLLVAGFLSLVALLGVSALFLFVRHRLRPPADVESAALNRIDAFLQTHPAWRFRRYRTPAGLRLIALHRGFDPLDAEVTECFNALGADPVYVRMCRNQRCFRARVNAKPWRIGIDDHLRPRPGVWPVARERLALRNDWVRRYESAARNHAACRYIDEIGTAALDPDVAAVVDWHDQLSRANSNLPLA